MYALRPTRLVVAAISLAACSGRDRDREAHARRDVVIDIPIGAATSGPRGAEGRARLSGEPSFREERDGSVSITTRSGALVMSLRNDSVVVAFSDSIRQAVQSKVTRSMQEERRESSGIGKAIEGVVQKSVSATMREVFDKARGFQVAALRDVSYEDGAIRFDFREQPTVSFDQVNTDGSPLLEQFHPADAARFVGAVRSRLR